MAGVVEGLRTHCGQHQEEPLQRASGHGEALGARTQKPTDTVVAKAAKESDGS